MSTTYEVTLGPTAIRIVLGLRNSYDRNAMAAALRTELLDGPNASKAVKLEFDSAGDAGTFIDPNLPTGVVYTAIPLSFNGYTALHRPMTEEELERLRAEQGRSVASRGFYVVDLLSAESGFSRARLV